MTGPATCVAACDGCGQIRAIGPTDRPHELLCRECVAGLYGGREQHERVRLFEPAPTVPAGQDSLDVP